MLARLTAAVTLGVLLAATAPNAAQAGEVVIEVTNVRSSDGLIRIALYTDPSTFPDRSGVHLGQVVPAEAGTTRVVFPDIVPGMYAIAMTHDEDGDGEFDTNLLGVPREGWGFSRNAMGLFGPPDFFDAAFSVTNEPTFQRLRVRY